MRTASTRLVSTRFATSLWLLLSISLLTHGADVTGVDVTGVVREHRDNRLVPLARATVIARPAGGGSVYASTKTDANGAYSLRNLPSPRIMLAAQRSGFYTHTAGGHDNRQIILDCSDAADCTGIDFELRKGAVITGRVIDEIGEPLQDVRIRVSAPESAERTREMPIIGSRSDDRGVFRVAALEPGAYLLVAENQRRGPRPSESQSTSVELQVDEGELLSGVELVVTDSPFNLKTFSIAGKLIGVKIEEGSSISIHSRSRRYGSSAAVQQDGSFELSGLPAGEYQARYVVRSGSNERRSPTRINLGRFVVESDRTDLALRPAAPTGVRGRIIIESGEPPETLRIRFLDQNGNWAMGALAEGPEYEFESQDFEPGEFRAAISVGFRRSNRLFIKEVRIGGEPSESKTFRVSEGVIEDIEFVLSDDFGKVHGRVKAPSDGSGLREGAQYTLGLKGPDRTYIVRADQLGRFSFDHITPGDYQICAWEVIARDRVYRDEVWEQAGPAVRTFPVDAGSDIEIDLTAVRP